MMAQKDLLIGRIDPEDFGEGVDGEPLLELAVLALLGYRESGVAAAGDFDRNELLLGGRGLFTFTICRTNNAD